MSAYNADAATLKLICHRVSAALTEKNLVAANLVIHRPVTMVSDWGGNHKLDPQRLDLTRNHSASIGRPIDFEYHRLFSDTKEEACQNVSNCHFE